MDSITITDASGSQTYTKPTHIAFVKDMQRIGADVFHYEGSNHYTGPATTPRDGVTRDEIKKACRVTLLKERRGRKDIFRPA